MVFCDGADSFGGCNGDELPIADLCDVGGGVIFGRKTGVAAGDRRRHCVGGGLDYFAPRYSQRGYGASGDAVGCGIFCLLLFVNQTAQRSSFGGYNRCDAFTLCHGGAGADGMDGLGSALD